MAAIAVYYGELLSAKVKFDAARFGECFKNANVDYKIANWNVFKADYKLLESDW